MNRNDRHAAWAGAPAAHATPEPAPERVCFPPRRSSARRIALLERRAALDAHLATICARVLGGAK